MAFRWPSTAIGTAFSGSTPRKRRAATAIRSLVAWRSGCAIELIQATTPQAKGRVERANQTLQDRLIKEMRLRGVSDMAGAQAFSREFIELWNAKFARPAAAGRRRASTLDERRRGARRSARASPGACSLQGPDLQRRGQGLLRQDQRPGTKGSLSTQVSN